MTNNTFNKAPPKRLAPKEWPEDWLANILSAVATLTERQWVDNAKPKSTGSIADRDWWLALLLVSRETDWSYRWLMSLLWSQIAPDGTVVIRPQGEPVPVVSRLSNDAMRAIATLRLPCRTGRVFGGLCSENAIFRRWLLILKRAGFDVTNRDLLPRYAARRRVAERAAEIATQGPPQTVSAFLEEVYRPLRLGGKAQRTLELYRFTVRNFSRFLKRDAMLSDLTDENVAALLAWMREKGRAVASVTKERDQLLAMWRFACLRHLVRDSPTLQRTKPPKRAPLAWQRDELVALFRAVDETPGWILGVRAAAWWRALLLVIWNSGERITAVMGLQWSHVDLAGGWLHVPAELRKGKREDKTFRLAPYTVEALLAIRQPDRDFVFQWPFTGNYLWNHYGAILMRAGLPNDARSKFHRLRCSVASHFEAIGGNATNLLGHSSRAITERCYLDERITKPVQAADLLFRPDDSYQVPPQVAVATEALAWL